MFHQLSLYINDCESEFGILKQGNKLKAINIKIKYVVTYYGEENTKTILIVLFVFSDHAVAFC